MHRISLFTLLLALFLTFRAGRAIQTSDCGSIVGQLTEMTVSGCESLTETCNLVRETNVTTTITFVPKKDVSSLTVVVHGLMMNMATPLPLPIPQACDDPESQVTCPLTKDTTYTYQVTLPVLKKYPKVSLTAMWQLQDEAKQDIVCVHVPVKVVDA